MLGCSSAVSGETCSPTFFDDFDKPLEQSAWQVIEGNGCDVDLCGWGNNEVQHYHRDNVAIRDGVLEITASTRGEQIISGKLVTEGQFTQRYGRFEARIKLPSGRGLWPAFWMMPDSPNRWPLAGEIDIMEWTGHEPERLIGAAHFGPLPPNNVHYSETLLKPVPWDAQWHDFAVEWQTDRIEWIVDGVSHAVMTPEAIAPYPWIFNEAEFYMILNVAVGGTLGGVVHPEDLPATMLVDWVGVLPRSCLENR